MKLLIGLSVVLFVAMWMSTIALVNKKNILIEDSRRLRRERDMYDSLYRSANTRLANFQDSINIHCICK